LFFIFFVVGRICLGILLIVAVEIVSSVGSMSFKVSGQMGDMWIRLECLTQELVLKRNVRVSKVTCCNNLVQ